MSEEEKEDFFYLSLFLFLIIASVISSLFLYLITSLVRAKHYHFFWSQINTSWQLKSLALSFSP
jgi:hypothetical protein